LKKRKKSDYLHTRAKLFKYALFGAVAGFTVSILIFFLSLGSLFSKQPYYHTIGFPFVLSEGIARYFNLCDAWNCLLFHLFGGVIVYSALGILIGAIIPLIKHTQHAWWKG